MANTNIINAVFGSGICAVTTSAYRANYGVKLRFSGIDLPTAFEVDFSNYDVMGRDSITMIGQENEVQIPDDLWDSGLNIYAYVYLHPTDDSGVTVYTVTVPVLGRPNRTEETPTPHEQTVIEQAISALNDAVEQTAADVETTTANAQAAAQSEANASVSERAAAASASAALASQNAAESAAQGATESASGAAESARNAANSAAQAAQSATDAQEYAEQAEQSAQSIEGDVERAESAAATATGKATEAASSAAIASTKATQAEQSATAAANSASAAATSASNAASSATAAQTAKTAAETAQGRAEQAAQSVSASAAQIAKNTDNFASEFSASTTYAICDYCVYGGTLYRFKNAHTGAWSASDVEATDVGGEIGDLKSAITQSNIITSSQLSLAFVRGNINPSGGNAGSSQKIRTNTYYEISDELNLTFSKGNYPSTIYAEVHLYDASNGFIRAVTISNAGNYSIDTSDAKKARFLIATASADSTTVIAPSDGTNLLSASIKSVRNLETDKTLSIENRPADAKSTGDAIQDVVKTLFNKELFFEWQRGKISSTGTNSKSSSTVYIRTSYRYKIEKANNHLAVPDNTTVEIYSYSTPYDNGFIEQVGTYTQSADITLAVGTFVRLVSYYTNLSDTPLSVGDSVKLSYYENAQEFYDNYNDCKLNDYSCISMFETLGVIGDSWASGSIHVPPNGTFVDTVYSMSWGQILARKNGITTTNYSEGGLSTKDWLSDNDHGLATLLADSAKNLYIINLGINDNTQINNGTLTLGTIADVNTEDFTQNPDTFFGCYGKIIGNIKQHAPKAIIITMSVARPNERNMDSYIKQIANKYEIPFIQLTDDEYFTSAYFYRSIYGGHMSAFGYSGMANAIQRLIQKYIIENPSQFALYDGLTT